MRFLTKRDENKFVLLRDGTVEKIEKISVFEWKPLLLSVKLKKENDKNSFRFYTGRGKTRSHKDGKDIIQISSCNLWD